MRNTVRVAAGVVAALVFALSAMHARAADAPRPNIVFILADDLGWADVGFHGPDIKTPNIDKLAASGVRLEQFYVQSVCSPTRAALLTGRYPMRLGLQEGVIRPWADYGMPLSERTLPQGLKEAGYETSICGKWHLGFIAPEYLPTRRGFDHQYGHYNGAIDYFTHMRDGGYDWHRDDKALRGDEGYSTALIAAESVRLIQKRDAAKPLFLYVAFNAVHAPHQVPAKYKEPYANLPEPRRTYAGMVAAMDEAIGTIQAAIDAAGMRGNTLIFFSSDNGGPAPGRVTSNGPLRAGKGTLYEGGTRVAACAAWEGKIKAGGIVNEPLHMVDWYPTLLNLAGATLEQKQPLDGRDAWPTIAEGKPSPHAEILLNSRPDTGAIRMGDWKLVLNGSRVDVEGAAEDGVGGPAAEKKPNGRQGRRAIGKNIELFDLSKDPYEKTNLAEANPEKLKALRARYDELAKEAVPPKQSGKQPAAYKVPKVWGEVRE
ncbi:MAG: arylsulfatase family protein [Phycisphaerales bacterium]|nr:arylsulfatase family protein [Phycisphaerales bacterium]